jgi:hypothetical protein
MNMMDILEDDVDMEQESPLPAPAPSTKRLSRLKKKSSDQPAQAPPQSPPAQVGVENADDENEGLPTHPQAHSTASPGPSRGSLPGTRRTSEADSPADSGPQSVNYDVEEGQTSSRQDDGREESEGYWDEEDALVEELQRPKAREGSAHKSTEEGKLSSTDCAFSDVLVRLHFPRVLAL